MTHTPDLHLHAGHMKLADFGSARMVEGDFEPQITIPDGGDGSATPGLGCGVRIEATGARIEGTAEYISPEVTFVLHQQR